MAAAKNAYPKVKYDVFTMFHSGLDYKALNQKAKVPENLKVRNVGSLPMIIRDSQWVKFTDRCF